MWKILGKEAVIPTMADVWRKRVVELSARRKEREKFLSLLEKGEMRVVLDGVRETWMFIINLPTDTKRPDLEFMADYLQQLDKTSKKPLMEMDGEKQKASIVVTTEEYGDDYDIRKALRTKWKKEGFPTEPKEEKAKKEKKKAKAK
ncbi:MAG: hypothetical protein LUO79_05815 [Methanomassiliicoccales archaeon]|nr:hypothetical protein [Methanomassiliicoccales archaeon]